MSWQFIHRRGNKTYSSKHKMIEIYPGDALKRLQDIEDQSVNTVVTSPPYYQQRNYQSFGQIGWEDSVDEFVQKLLSVFKEVKRVLRDDGTLWLNIGDSWLAKKQLGLIPFQIAHALQKDGWILRQDIIWHKPNPMVESVKDRCTHAHEYIFLFSKDLKYYFDHDQMREDCLGKDERVWSDTYENSGSIVQGDTNANIKRTKRYAQDDSFRRNRRSVWQVTTKPFPETHFATFPKDLIEPCVLAGCPEHGVVLDPFGGSGTTCIVAEGYNRNSKMIELNNNYIDIAKNRIHQELGMMGEYKIL